MNHKLPLNIHALLGAVEVCEAQPCFLGAFSLLETEEDTQDQPPHKGTGHQCYSFEGTHSKCSRHSKRALNLTLAPVAGGRIYRGGSE